MKHILDNPIYNALSTSNSPWTIGTERAKVIDPELGAFAGLQENSIDDLMALLDLIPTDSVAVLFTPDRIIIPSEWEILVEKPLLQMTYKGRTLCEASENVVKLKEDSIKDMLSLIALTEPGPFLPRTIELGNYEGIFEKGKLVAMAGQRLHPDPYIEISAVCTHPEHTGKGYAATLVRSQIDNILQRSSVPFLHVLSENEAAYRLYLKLGFQLRKEMQCYVLRRPE